MEDCRRKITAELQVLEASSLEVNSFNAHFSMLWYYFDLIGRYLIDRVEFEDEFEECSVGPEQVYAAMDKWNDLISLAKKVVTKNSSKSELVDTIVKKTKILEELERMRSQLLAVSNSLGITPVHSPFAESMYSRFVEAVDNESFRNTVKDMKYLVENKGNNDTMTHLDSLDLIIKYLNKVEEIPENYIRMISTDELVPSTMAWFSFIDGDLETVTENNTVVGNGDNERSLLEGGSFGRTCRGVWMGALVAIKKIPLAHFQSGIIGAREACVCMQSNSHLTENSPYLASLIAVSFDSDLQHLYFVQTLAPEGSLFYLINNPSVSDEARRFVLTPKRKFSILLDIAYAVKHLHSKGIVSGRIKDSNILLFDGFRAKLADFAVHDFLVNSCRFNNKGSHGERWVAPELLRFELCSAEARSFSKPKTLGKARPEAPFLLEKSVDVYGLGLLALVLLTEKKPYANVQWDEGVRSQIANGTPPSVPQGYNDKEEMHVLEDFIHSCCFVKSAFSRPSTEAAVEKIENMMCDIELRHAKLNYDKRSADMEEVQQEIKEIKKKINDHVELITRGKDIIAKKDADKILIHNPQKRREREQEIDKARDKLRGFDDELTGLRDDLKCAEEDLGVLFGLRKEAKDALDGNVALVLASFKTMPQEKTMDQEGLMRKYCTDKEKNKILDLLWSETSLLEFIEESASIGGPDDVMDTTREFDAIVSNTFRVNCVDSERRGHLESQLRANNQSLDCQYLIDNLDIIFRVPLNPSIFGTPPQSLLSGATRRSMTAARRSSINRNSAADALVFQEVDTGELDSDDEDASEAAATHNPLVKWQQQQQQSKQPKQTIEVVSCISSSMHTVSVPMPSQIVAKPDPHSSRPAAGGVPTSASTAVLEETVPALPLPRPPPPVPPAGMMRKDITGDINSNGSKVKVEELVVEEEEEEQDHGFPRDEWDRIHVQFLAAICGSWDEAVGMRRRGQQRYSLEDDQINQYIDRGHSPLHIAAKLGHFFIVKYLIEREGIDPNSVDDLGETPLHCACQRGHVAVVQALIENYGVEYDIVSGKGLIPLQQAVSAGCLQVVEYLLEKAPQRTDPHFVDPVFGATLLHWACLSSAPALVEYLLTAYNLGLETTAEEDGCTCLQWACYGGTLPVMKYLIESCHANAKCESPSGMTCMHMVTLSGNVEKTQYLIETVGLNSTTKNEQGQSPFDIATGACVGYLKLRKAQGFLSGSVVSQLS